MNSDKDVNYTQQTQNYNKMLLHCVPPYAPLFGLYPLKYLTTFCMLTAINISGRFIKSFGY